MAENTKKVVVDASVILAKLLPDEKQSSKVKKLFISFGRREVDFIAPQLLKFEISNALKSAVKQKRLTQLVAEKLLAAFLELPVIYQEVDFLEVLKTALKENLSAYDAAYVYLAMEKKTALVSLDQRLIKVGGKVGGAE